MSFLAVVQRPSSNLGRAPSCRQGAPLPDIIRTTRTSGFVPALAAWLVLALAGCGDSTLTGAPSDPDPDFDIEIRYWPGTDPGDLERLRIGAAAARWERLLSTGLPDAVVRGSAGCGEGSPELQETVDDLVVYVRYVELDALAESGPCLVRRDGTLPITGTIWLDGPNRVGQLQSAVLEALVMHELAHVLGFGSLWKTRSLLRDASIGGGDDPHFVGELARSWFEMSGGTDYQGAKVPVDDSGVRGTADTHWRLFPFEEELMTPVIFYPDNPLSPVTAAAMADLGYDVDVGEAEPWQLPFARGSSRSVGVRGTIEDARVRVLELDEAAPRWAIGVVDAAGRIVGRLPRR